MINWPEQLPDLVSEKLTLRQWKLDDAESVFHICQDPEIIEWTTIPVPYTFEHATEYVESRRHDYEKHQAISYVSDLDGKASIAVSLHHINEFDHWAEIGYWTAPAARGRGLTATAVQLVTGFAFSIGIKRIHAIADPDNIASQGVLRKAGFNHEATLHNGITRRSGEQSDAFMFAAFPEK